MECVLFSFFQISGDELKVNVEKLSSLLLLPWFLNDKFTEFRTSVSSLVEALRKYESFLGKQKDRTYVNHRKQEPVRSFQDNWSFEIVEVNSAAFRKVHTIGGVEMSHDFTEVESSLERLDYYEPLDTVNFEPDDTFTRRSWLQNLNLPFPIGKFTFHHGNYLGNLTVIWRQPEDKQSRDSTEDIRVINEVKTNMTRYATRSMRKNFMETYSRSTKDKPAILRSMFNFLTGYSNAPENKQEESVDQRVCQFLLNSDDPKLILDLRKNNGRVRDQKYDPFWKELQSYLNEKSVVHERRHTETAYMPFAISVTDLRQQILARLPPNSEAPSESWIRLNFSPSNEYAESAARYTGMFNVRHSVQQRLLRARHADSDFAYYQFTLLKHFAVKWCDFTIMQCLDDKAIIPVGEPGKPTTASSRVHNPGLVSGTGPQLLCLDHDYHVCGMVPSVCFQIEIPSDVKDSFYHGDVHITLKDKVFQASSPLRHVTENVKIIRETRSSDEVSCNWPILVR